MPWSTQRSDEIFNAFTTNPGTMLVIGPGDTENTPWTRTEAEQIPAAIQQHATERQIRVEIVTRPVNGDSGYVDLEVRHLVG